MNTIDDDEVLWFRAYMERSTVSTLPFDGVSSKNPRIYKKLIEASTISCQHE